MTAPVHKRPDADSLLFGGGASADLKDIGARVEGIIIDKDTQHETDFTTKEKKYFKSGDPVYQLVLTLQTNQRDPQNPDDDGIRKVYFKQQWRQELSKAINKTGTKVIALGAWVRLTRTHDAPNPKGGNPSKCCSVEYLLPADAQVQPAPVQQFAPGGMIPAQPQPVYQAPVQAPVYAPAPAAAPAPVYAPPAAPVAPVAPAPVVAPAPAVAAAPAVDPSQFSPEMLALMAAMAQGQQVQQ